MINLFGLVIMTKKNHDLMLERWYVYWRIQECHRWFSGWEDLDVIWDFLLGKSFQHVDEARRAYAEKRNTDVYGQKVVKN